MNYRRKEDGVKAVQFVLGKPIHEAIKVFGYNPLKYDGEKSYIVSAVKNNRYIKVNGVIPVEHGDYIVEENGVLSVMDEVSFLELFEPVKKPMNENVYNICRHFHFHVNEVESLTSGQIELLTDSIKKYLQGSIGENY